MSAGLLFIRVFVGGVMLLRGIGKAQNYNYIVDTFPDIWGMGSATSLAVVTIVEILFSALLVIGFMTRTSSVILALGMLAASVMSYTEGSMINTEVFVLYLGIYVFIAISGAGVYSVDGAVSYRTGARL